MAPTSTRSSQASTDGLVDPNRKISFSSQVVGVIKALLLDRRYFWHLTTLLALGELVLGLLIIWKVPYTKIDWPAYMEQVEGFLAGERDYSKLEGDTGPLVYPALHLYIYTAFHQFLPAAHRVRPAQYIFLGIYLTTFLAIATIYYLSGRNESSDTDKNGKSRYSTLPQALLIPLCLSKRAHSIFLLRLFNDPLAMVLLYSSVIAMMIGGKKGWKLGCCLYSLALGVKMNILLFLPGLLVLLFQYRGMFDTVQGVALILIIQLALPAPFFLSLTAYDLSKAYFNSAFDFSRRFLYEWTVNWRFIDVTTFLSRKWALSLLATQAVSLIGFAWFKWSPVPGGTWVVLKRGLLGGSGSWSRAPVSPSHLPSNHIPLVLFTSNLIGMTFARSLHYQFHSWYFHQIPFLLYHGGAWGSLPLGIALWGMIEWAWATAPSTSASSGVMFAAHLVILSGLWVRSPKPPRIEQKKA